MSCKKYRILEMAAQVQIYLNALLVKNCIYYINTSFKLVSSVINFM